MFLFLNSIDAKNSSALSDTSSFASGCKIYKVYFTNIQRAGNSGTHLVLSFWDGGSEQTGSYSTRFLYAFEGGTGSEGGENNERIHLQQNDALLNSDSRQSGEITIYLPQSDSDRVSVTWTSSTTVSYNRKASFHSGSGYWTGASFIPSGFLLKLSSGNILVGNVSIYGITR